MKQTSFNLVTANLWIFTFLSYIFRSIYPPLAIFFWVGIIILLPITTFSLVKGKKYILIWEFIKTTKWYLFVGIFIGVGLLLSDSFYSHPVKDFGKFIVLTLLLFIYFIYQDIIRVESLLKKWVVISSILGTIAILIWYNYIFFQSSEYSQFFLGTQKLSSSISLVSDYNFYSLFFILSIIIIFYGLWKNLIIQKQFIIQPILWILILNVILSTSRRALVVFFIMFLIGVIYIILTFFKASKRKSFTTNLRVILGTFFIIFLILILLFPFRTRIIKDQSNRDKITLMLDRYVTLLNSKMTDSVLELKLWPQYSKYIDENINWSDFNFTDSTGWILNQDIINNISNFNSQSILHHKLTELQCDSEAINLFYNSNFYYGNSFWRSIVNDTVETKIIKTPYGKGIRVSRGNGNGYWPLSYIGRDIYYHKDNNYTYRFLFKVIEGSGVPFNIGWNIKENGNFIYDIPNKTIVPLDNGWNICIATYKFLEDHHTPVIAFMNTQEPNTIIEFANIELLVNKSLVNKAYSDQNIVSLKSKEENNVTGILNSEKSNYLRDPRSQRIKISLDIFHCYSLTEKLIGTGYDYMFLLASKTLYPDKSIVELKRSGNYDYPHNPIVSSFLYSGLIGGLYYMLFLVLVLVSYVKYFKYHNLFFIMFIVTLFFSMLSGNTHFSVPTFSFLSIIPFLTKFRIDELSKLIKK